MKKKSALLILILIGVFTANAGVLALEIDWPPSPGFGTELTNQSEITDLVQYLYEWLIALGGLAAFFAITYAGFVYLTSAGDPGRTKAAKGRLQSAVFGLALLFGAYMILNTINPRLTNLTLPSLVPSDVLGEPSFNLSLDENLRDCAGVEISSEPTIFSTKEHLIQAGETKNSPEGSIESVAMWGSCQVKLYNSSGCGSEKNLIAAFPNYDYITPEEKKGEEITIESHNIDNLRSKLPQEEAAYCIKVEKLPEINF